MKVDLKVQKLRLEAKKNELERSIAALTQAHHPPLLSDELHDEPRESADTATDFLEVHEEQSILVNEQSLLTLVENALQRLADGTYRLCQQCGQPIPPERLDAIPWADHDVSCEQQIEQQNLSREDVYGNPQTF